MKKGKRLSWDELADFYQKKTGKKARIQPMQIVQSWAEKQPEIGVDDEDYFIWLGEEEKAPPNKIMTYREMKQRQKEERRRYFAEVAKATKSPKDAAKEIGMLTSSHFLAMCKSHDVDPMTGDVLKETSE